LRLLACAFCRRHWDALPDRRSHLAVEVGERLIDGGATEEERRAAFAAAEAVRNSTAYGSSAQRWAACAVYCVDPNPSWNPAPTETFTEEELTNLYRELCGNPFRSIALSYAWLAWNDSTIPKIAQAIYEERAFDRMPILADALEDAGCDNADILRHCREPGEHVRGCWVVDLLLGKE
jgi:hypothetical protein